MALDSRSKHQILALLPYMVGLPLAGALVAWFVSRSLAMAATVVVCVLTVVVIVGVIVFSRTEVNSDRRDKESTFDPLIERFNASQDTDALEADYQQWKQGRHSQHLRFEAGKEAVHALARGGAYGLALQELKALDELELDEVDSRARDRFREDGAHAIREERAIAKQRKRRQFREKSHRGA